MPRGPERGREPDSDDVPGERPDGWKDKLADLLVEALVSPLHDQDVWTDEDEAENPVHKAGSPKKAHWHIVVSYKNPVTFAKAREVFDEIGAVVPPEPKAKVKDFQQMARYLCHLISPRSTAMTRQMCRLLVRWTTSG